MKTAPQTMNSEPPLIELSEATVASPQIPDKPMLQDVNWSIMQGDFWVVMGLPNSGKSALLATAAGLLKPVGGVHRLFGRNTNSADGDELLRERLRIGFVFADGGRVFRHLTVAENLGLPLCYHHNCSLQDKEHEIMSALDLTGLSFLASQPAGRLSRGWRQRVGLARALIMQPEVLLLDSPLAGLDPRQSAWWLEFLARLSTGHELFQNRPVALAIATDDLLPWLSCGKQFALLNNERLAHLGGRDDLANCQEPLLRGLLAAQEKPK